MIESPAEAASAPARAPKKAQRPRKRAGDPVVRWLVIVIAGVIILWLVALASAMFFGVMPNGLPRTEAEHDLQVLGAQVDAGQATPQIYAQYVDALIRAGQLSKAQSALDQTLKTAKTDTSYLLAQQAHLLLVRKDYKGAVAAADKAMSQAQKELKAFMDENVKNNRLSTAGAVMPDSYKTAALVKADALVASEDFAAAVKAYDTYLKQDPTASDVLVERGQVKLKVNDKKGAEKDFRAALTYVPDFAPALAGLKQIGAAQ